MAGEDSRADGRTLKIEVLCMPLVSLGGGGGGLKSGPGVVKKTNRKKRVAQCMN